MNKNNFPQILVNKGFAGFFCVFSIIDALFIVKKYKMVLKVYINIDEECKLCHFLGNCLILIKKKALH